MNEIEYCDYSSDNDDADADGSLSQLNSRFVNDCSSEDSDIVRAKRDEETEMKEEHAMVDNLAVYQRGAASRAAVGDAELERDHAARNTAEIEETKEDGYCGFTSNSDTDGDDVDVSVSGLSGENAAEEADVLPAIADLLDESQHGREEKSEMKDVHHMQSQLAHEMNRASAYFFEPLVGFYELDISILSGLIDTRDRALVEQLPFDSIGELSEARPDQVESLLMAAKQKTLGKTFGVRVLFELRRIREALQSVVVQVRDKEERVAAELARLNRLEKQNMEMENENWTDLKIWDLVWDEVRELASDFSGAEWWPRRDGDRTPRPKLEI